MLNAAITMEDNVYSLDQAHSTRSQWATCCLWSSVMLRAESFQTRKHLEPCQWESWDRMPKQFWKLKSYFFTV